VLCDALQPQQTAHYLYHSISDRYQSFLLTGVVASSAAVVNAALLLAGSLRPHWLAFIDAGHLYLTSQPEEARDAKSATLYSALGKDVPSLYAATGGVNDCLVYARILP
jgi:hypothetical protein